MASPVNKICVVVDDQPMLGMVATSLLQGILGNTWAVHYIDDPVEAEKAAQQKPYTTYEGVLQTAATAKKTSAMVVDYNMPVINGLHVARTRRKYENSRDDVPQIPLLLYSTEKVKKAYKVFDASIPKPINLDGATAVLRQIGLIS